jgi:hypothetical protein
VRAGRMKRGYKTRKWGLMVDYRVFGAGVLIQSGGPVAIGRSSGYSIEFEVVFEIAHVMSPWYTEPVSRYHSPSLDDKNK